MKIDKDLKLQTLAGQIWPDEGRWLRAAAAKVNAKQAIVELGAGRGKSACYLSTGSSEGKRANIWSVDLWGSHHDTTAARRGSLAKAMYALQLQLEGVESLVTAIEAPTAEVGKQWNGPKVGLLFVDANHSREAVKNDLTAWQPHLADAASVALHDWGVFPGVEQAAGSILGQPQSVIHSLAIYCT